jgi:hypothetical protein
MFGVLQEVLGENRVADGLRVPRQDKVPVVDLIGRPANSTLRTVAVELLVPEIWMAATPWIAATARSTRVQTMPLTLCVSLILDSRRPPDFRTIRRRLSS